MSKSLHNDVYDKGLEQISNSANWGGGVMSMTICAGAPANVTEASTLYPTGKRISTVIAMAGGDFSLGNKSGGGREITVSAKTDAAQVTVVKADSGTATSGGANTLTDTGKAWTNNVHAGRIVKITGGTGSGQSGVIASNTATQLTVSVNWATPPDATSTYEIREDIVAAFYDGGGTPRLLAVTNESNDAEVANGTTLNIPAQTIGISSPI